MSNQISDTNALANLTRLNHLFLTLNQISDIGPLAPLTNLVSLALGSNEVVDITPEEVMGLLAAGKKVVLVDVRSPKEQRVSMLPGAISREVFLRDIDNYRDHYIIGYCTISYRSGKLAQELRQRGINMLNLEGGLLAWLHAGGKVWAKGDETRQVHVFGKKWDLAPARYQTVWRRLTLR